MFISSIEFIEALCPVRMILGVGPKNFWIPVSDGFLDLETSQKHFSLHKRIFEHMINIFKLMMDWWMN